MKQVDFLIIGQGLAGSILAYKLIKRGFRIHCIDLNTGASASQVAIGMVNPITGKRLVKSWLIDDLIPCALSDYTELEKEFRIKFIHFSPISRIIPNEEIFSQWKPNFDIAVNEGFIDPDIKTIELNNQEFKYFNILQGFWLDTKKLIQSVTEWLHQNNALSNEIFDFDEYKILDHTAIYQNIEAKQTIFCEGYQAINNPYFNHLPFNLNKGEVIDLSILDYELKSIIKKNIFIVPTYDHFRVGATYDRDHINNEISDSANQYFQERVNSMFGDKQYHLYNQQAAIRPATRDRRPFIGRHPQFPNLLIFNGFGAKAVSLVPYFSNQLLDWLQDEKKELNVEANINRFD